MRDPSARQLHIGLRDWHGLGQYWQKREAIRRTVFFGSLTKCPPASFAGNSRPIPSLDLLVLSFCLLDSPFLADRLPGSKTTTFERRSLKSSYVAVLLPRGDGPKLGDAGSDCSFSSKRAQKKKGNGSSQRSGWRNCPSSDTTSPSFLRGFSWPPVEEKENRPEQAKACVSVFARRSAACTSLLKRGKHSVSKSRPTPAFVSLLRTE